MIVDPPTSSLITRFSLFFYSSSFASFLTTIHRLSETSQEFVLDSLSQQTMQKELSDLYKTTTWNLISLPPGKPAIGSQWVYKIKTKSDWVC